MPPQNHPEAFTQPNEFMVLMTPGVAFEDHTKETKLVFALILLDEPCATISHPQNVTKLLADITLPKLPDELSSITYIQYHIDLIPGATLPHLPHYEISTKEHRILQSQVDDLVLKGLVCASLSLCAIPALFTHKKDGF